jgi:hypothetical protein
MERRAVVILDYINRYLYSHTTGTTKCSMVLNVNMIPAVLI